jgi:mono/diheme cytochrome c family protein
MHKALSSFLAPLAICAGLQSAPVIGAEESAELPKGDAGKGRTLYLRYCRGCHGVDGQGDGLVFMPHVNNLTRKGYIDLLPDAYIYTAIAKGGLAIGKSSYMPAWEEALSREQILDIIAHVRALPLHENH